MAAVDAMKKQASRSTPGDAGRSIQITLHPESHLAVARFATNTTLTGEHGKLLIDALASLAGASGEPFALLADTAGVSGTNADYRAVTAAFFRQHRGTARIALLNLAPAIRVVAEMFRVALGLDLKTFADEDAARSWLRTKGIAA